jgi:hypothetical protein
MQWFGLQEYTNTSTLTFVALRQFAVPLFAELFGFVNLQSGAIRGVETPTTFPTEIYHSHLQEVLNAAVEWTEQSV